MVQITRTIRGRRRKNWRNSFLMSAPTRPTGSAQCLLPEPERGQREHDRGVDDEQGRTGPEPAEADALEGDAARDLHEMPGGEQVRIPLKHARHGVDGEEEAGEEERR